MWLLMQGRIQSRSNLLKKHVVDTAVCGACAQMEETPEHVIMRCQFAKDFWQRIGLTPSLLSSGGLNDFHNVQCPSNIPQKHFATFIALCCWHLWKRRNGVIFRSERAGHQQMLAACISEAKLWKSRLPKKDRELAVGLISGSAYERLTAQYVQRTRSRHGFKGKPVISR
jgi:hypothetical protein